MIDNLFYHCTPCDLPVTIHIAPRFGASYGIVDEQGLPRLEKMLKKHKDMKLLGHSAPFWGEISKDLKPEDRILYGCDICQKETLHPYHFDTFLDQMVADGMLSPENYYKIVRGNAIKLLNLPPDTLAN